MPKETVLLVEKPKSMPDRGVDLTMYNNAVRMREEKRQTARMLELYLRNIGRHQREKYRAQRRERIRTVTITVLIAILTAEAGAVAALVWALAR